MSEVERSEDLSTNDRLCNGAPLWGDKVTEIGLVPDRNPVRSGTLQKWLGSELTPLAISAPESGRHNENYRTCHLER